jgi:hypothetical protein
VKIASGLVTAKPSPHTEQASPFAIVMNEATINNLKNMIVGCCEVETLYLQGANDL